MRKKWLIALLCCLLCLLCTAVAESIPGEEIIFDDVPPVISGVRNYKIVSGEDFDYLSGVTASDDRGDEVELRIDDAFQGATEEGIYYVVFTAVDASGNETVARSMIEVHSANADTIAPVITGLANQSTIIDTAIDYLSDIQVYDNMDDEPALEIDHGGLDFTVAGEYTITCTAQDKSGNMVQATFTVTVKEDDIPPVIEGAHDLTACIGDTIRYKEGVTVTDNHDPSPKLTVDNSAVNMNKAGIYKVRYIAKDKAGNKSEVDVILTLSAKPYDENMLQKAEALGREVLDEILTDDMSQMQKAFSIYRWVRRHIRYSGTSDKSNWVVGAYKGLTTKRGDCYNYYAVSKLLLTLAGIENTDIEKTHGHATMHYWNLINIGTGWYHFDACPSSYSGANFFMLTDAELAKWDKEHRQAHPFDGSLYPARATESVQSKVNYGTGKIRE